MVVMSGSVAVAEEIVEEVFDVILHADLSGVVSGGVKGHAATGARAFLCRGLAGSIEGQREAPEHGGDNPAGVSFIQQQAGGLAFSRGDRPARQSDFIDEYPGNGVLLHGHLIHVPVGVAMCGRGVVPPAATTGSSAVRSAKAVGRPVQSQSRVSSSRVAAMCGGHPCVTI